jgi:dTDP-4-amino-4,6-dideoxygalactose transaminase
MKIINYGRHFIDKNDINAVIKVLKSESLTTGKIIEDFENKIVDNFGGQQAAAVSSGTAALHLCGLALGWKKKDIVIAPINTFVATINSIIYSGAQPYIIDIDPQNYQLDLNILETTLKRLKRKVHSVISVDFAGQPADWKSLKFLSKKYNFKLINDACHSIGAKYKNDKKYLTKYADLVTHSYHAVKNMTTGEGGAVISKNKKYIEKIKCLRSHGLKYKEKNVKQILYYDLKSIGYNYRMTNFQATLGIQQLKKINNFIDHRKKIAKIYDSFFEDDDRFRIPFINKDSDHSYHLYPLKIKFEMLKISKPDFFDLMLKKGIRLQTHYMPLHYHSIYKKKFNFAKKKYPVAENYFKSIVSLPIYYNLKIKDVLYVIEKIKKLSK